MFISNDTPRIHEWVNKMFTLGEEIRNMSGIFTKGSSLRCSEVYSIDDTPRSVWLTDDMGNKLFINVDDFREICKV